MKREKKRSVLVARDGDRVTIDVPRLFTADGIVHGIALIIGVAILVAVLHTQANLSGILPPSVNAHAHLLLWTILPGGCAVFILLCLMGIGRSVFWRLGKLGSQGYAVALTMYSVHIAVSPASTEITERWWIRRKTRRVPTAEIATIEQDESDLIITSTSGQRLTWAFSLYPPTVKCIKREIELAAASAGGSRA